MAFFREPNFDVAWTMICRTFTFAGGMTWYHPYAIGAIFAKTLHHVIIAFGKKDCLELRGSTIVTPIVLLPRSEILDRQ